MGGGSGKWLKSLINLKKPQLNEEESVSGKGKKKWSLWRSSSANHGQSQSMKGFKAGRVSASDRSDSSSFAVDDDDTFAAAMATIIRAHPRDFMAVRQEWAALRIQTVFRGFLARRALRALKAVVRLQAIFRGRKVRKQAAITLRCMQALVRVQAQVRALSVRTTSEGKDVQNLVDEHHNKTADPVKQAEQGWCDSPGTVEQVRTKLQTRQEGAIKRERAVAYYLSQQQLQSNAYSNLGTNKLLNSLKDHKLEKNSSGWSWLDGWMAAKPWENRLIEEIHTDQSEVTPPFSRKSGGFRSNSSESESVEVRRNNVTTRISAKPPITSQFTQSSSDPGSEFLYDDCSTSTSSSPVFRNTGRKEVCNISKPSYMNLTMSTKAKQRACKSHLMPRHSGEDCQFLKKSMTSSNGETTSSAGSDPYSVNLSHDLYPPIQVDKYQWVKRR